MSHTTIDPVPIACSLTAAQLRQRAEDTAALAREALRARHTIQGGVRLVFAAEVHDRLERVVAAESECCPFLTMDLTNAGDDIVLEITGPTDAAPIIEELFAAR